MILGTKVCTCDWVSRSAIEQMSEHGEPAGAVISFDRREKGAEKIMCV